MTTVNDFVDILRIIREQPEWGEALRSALLSKEVLELPQRLAEFAETTNKRLANLEGDVSELKSGQARLEGDVAELKSGQARLERSFARMEGEFGNIKGDTYELKVGTNIASIASQHLNLRGIRVLKGLRAADDMAFLDLLFAAEDRGDITRAERGDASNVDIVVQGRRKEDQATLYVVLEVSRTAADNDINRAVERSQILHRATGREALPAVVCAHKDEARVRLAEDRKVALVSFGE
jgi:hypothetical protein